MTAKRGYYNTFSYCSIACSFKIVVYFYFSALQLRKKEHFFLSESGKLYFFIYNELINIYVVFSHLIRHFKTFICLLDVVERYVIFEKFQEIKFCNFDRKKFNFVLYTTLSTQSKSVKPKKLGLLLGVIILLCILCRQLQFSHKIC